MSTCMKVSLQLFFALFLFSMTTGIVAHSADYAGKSVERPDDSSTEPGKTQIRYDHDDGTASLDPLDNWVWRNPLPTGGKLLAVAYGNSTFVAVGEDGAILTSPDGVAWTQRTSGMVADLHAVAYGNGAFVAVGEDGTIVTSPDAVTWTPRESGLSDWLTGVAYGSGLFVAVGFTAFANKYATSPDGITWTARERPWYHLSSIAYGGNTFVAAGTNAGSCKVFTSSDGLTWTQEDLGTVNCPDGYCAAGVVYGNGIFLVVTNRLVFASPDGSDWTLTYSNNHNPFYAVTYGNGTFVAVGNYIASSSPDGVEWTDVSDNVGSMLGNVYGTGYGNGTFVAVGEIWADSGGILTSSNGKQWRRRTSGTRKNLSRVAYGNDMFVAVGEEGAIVTSTDWVTWTTKDLGRHFSFQDIAFGAGIFVAVGSECVSESDEHALIFTSTDKTRWTRRTSGLSGSLRGVAWGKNRFVAVSPQGTLITSPDGIQWTVGNSRATTMLLGVAYGNDMFVVIGAGQTFTSPDGLNWTVSNVAGLFQPSAITYGNGLFVAVGFSGVFSSPDGVTWTYTASGYYSGVAFGGNTFVAVGNYTTLSSADGTRWTLRKSASLGAGVGYGAGSFVAVGGSGGIRQSIVEPRTFALAVSKTGNGTGTVLSDLDGIDCGHACSAPFAQSTTVTLTAAPSSGSILKSWSGCASTSADTCNVTMDKTKTVAATFALQNPVKLTVSKTKQNNGDGEIVSSDGSIDCGANCSRSYAKGSSVTLTANPGALSYFNGWSIPSCAGTTCTVAITANQTVKATFIGPETLKVTNSSVNKGTGTVTNSTWGIDCAPGSKGHCKASSIPYGTQVTLTATPDSGSSVLSWSVSDCTGTTCSVTMNKARNVTVKFKK